MLILSALVAQEALQDTDCANIDADLLKLAGELTAGRQQMAQPAFGDRMIAVLAEQVQPFTALLKLSTVPLLASALLHSCIPRPLHLMAQVWPLHLCISRSLLIICCCWLHSHLRH